MSVYLHPKVRTRVSVTEVNNDKTSLGNSNKQASIYQGPVVQSVVSLTSSVRVISLTVLADSIYNILIFFAEKM